MQAANIGTKILGLAAFLGLYAMQASTLRRNGGGNGSASSESSRSSSKEGSAPANSTSSNSAINTTITTVPATNTYGRRVTILYGTTSGTSRKLSTTLAANISKLYQIPVSIMDLKDYDEENLSSEDIVLLIMSTWSGGKPTDSALRFCDWLADMSTDFRVNKDHFRKVHFAVLGVGASVYGDEHFCTAARNVSKNLQELGGTQICPIVVGDYESNLEDKFIEWKKKVILFIGTVADENALEKKPKANKSNVGTSNYKTAAAVPVIKKDKADEKQKVKGAEEKSECCKSGGGSSTAAESESSGCCKDKDNSNNNNNNSNDNSNSNEEGGCCAPPDSDEDEEEEEDRINNAYVDDDYNSDNSDAEGERTVFSGIEDGHGAGGEGSTLIMSGSKGVTDLEDLAGVVSEGKKGDKNKTNIYAAGAEPREMVTKLQRKALNKEGYKIIGSHSAVKLCRWTKNQMRGRGGCYKHTFYGITSYQCMEATPSLACANKCVFCWRHHKNPVGTEWRWKEDEPAFIVHEAVEIHRAMIREMKGVPGVLPERLKEGDTVRHCALSLVGEPIMYPRINDMLQELHVRDISSFLVTNAQFPERIRDLDPVTQLYVSIDAPTKDSLKAVDRPLFKDFWERYIASLNEINRKEIRTVFRLTLIKSWNMEEMDEYANLIEIGRPDFIEIKAVTYCGKSDASSLTMQNVPWHTEVCAFAEALAARVSARNKTGFNYSIATEHEHSCCILLAREDKFFVNGTWHTWIDYAKFSALIREYYASGKTTNFTSVDYMAETPPWALYKSETKGFDPEEQRWRRNKNGEKVENTYKSSESGCG